LPRIIEREKTDTAWLKGLSPLSASRLEVCYFAQQGGGVLKMNSDRTAARLLMTERGSWIYN
jgi:hypothetical protein